MDVHERLKAVIEELGLVQKNFAESIGTTQATLSRQLKGIHKIDKQAALAIQSVHGVSATWLLTGEGEMFLDGSSVSSVKGEELDRETMESVIRIVLEMFNKEGLEMPPDKFAKFILFMYDRHKENKGGITEKEIKDNIVLLKKFA